MHAIPRAAGSGRAIAKSATTAAGGRGAVNQRSGGLTAEGKMAVLVLVWKLGKRSADQATGRYVMGGDERV